MLLIELKFLNQHTDSKQQLILLLLLKTSAGIHAS